MVKRVFLLNVVVAMEILDLISRVDPHATRTDGIKAVPLQAWSGPEGSRKLRFPDYMTMTQNGSKVVSLMHRPPLPQENAPGTHFC